MMNGAPLVGLAPDITLSRRVQLAVLAHIRHQHTRYDHLLRETTYVNARKAVESLCLDILVKWRGDEETGRDQLDEILREVVVISDSEDSEEDDDEQESGSTGESSLEDIDPVESTRPSMAPTGLQSLLNRHGASVNEDNRQLRSFAVQGQQPNRRTKVDKKQRLAVRKAQRGFHRYQVVRDRAWLEAVERQRRFQDALDEPLSMQRSPSHMLPAQQQSDHLSWRQGLQPDTRQRDIEYDPRQSMYEPFIRRGHDENAFYPGSETGAGVAAAHPQYTTMDHGAEHASAYRVMAHPHTGIHEPFGSRTTVRHRETDLKDYLVQSIEPRSPEATTFLYDPAHNPPTERFFASRPAGSDRDQGFRISASGFRGEDTMTSGHLRDDHTQKPLRPLEENEFRILPRRVQEMAATRPLPRPLSAPTRHDEESLPRQEPRPMMIERSQVPYSQVLREDPSHLMIGNYGRLPDHEPTSRRQPHIVYGDRRPFADHPEIIEIRRAFTPDPRSNAEYHGAASQNDRPRRDVAHSSLDVDFIPVSNVFPRRYEPPPPTGAPVRARQGVAYPFDDRPRESTTYNPHILASSRPPNDRAYLPREERVVGIEYVDRR
jgi:hypothetical protein